MKKISLVVVSLLIVVTSVLFYQQYQKDQDKKALLAHQNDVQARYQPVVSMTKQTSLYDAQAKVIGSVEMNVVFELEEFVMNDYFKVKGQDFYVYYQDIQAGVLEVKDTRYQSYIPFNESIVVDQASFFNQNNELLLQVNLPYTLDIIVKDDDHYGVLWMNQLINIKKTDVKEVIKNNQELTQPLAKDVPVLMYHFFYDDLKGETAPDGNWISRTNFAGHLDYFKENNYLTLSMQEVEWFIYGKIQLPENIVAITIDDGDPSIFNVVEEEIQNRNMHATVFLVTAWNGFLASENHPSLEFQSHSHDMHQGGCSDQHGGRILCIPTEEGVQDVKTSAEILGRSNAFCYPFGDYNEHAKEILRLGGYPLAFTVEGGKASPSMDPLELPRVRISTGTTVEYLKAKLND